MRKTKIICTIGPACETYDVLKQLALGGMDCCRLNFSHGTHLEHKEKIDNIKKVRKDLNIALPIMLDTSGPEIRIGVFEKDFINLKAGDEFNFYLDKNYLGNEKGVSLPCSQLYKDVSVGDTILVDDGKVGFLVQEVTKESVKTQVINSGRISNRKSVNIPNVIVNMPYLSEKDKSDLLFGIKEGVEFIAASFARTDEDMKILREFLNNNGGREIKVIGKIENRQGIRNLISILQVVDGIMIARGDLGVEIPFHELPAIQKDIIKKCYRAGKYVVTATQMLESMTNHPRPTRAEVSDVANAIYDGTTIIMLSGETAMGDYPVESLKAMAEIALTTERAINYKKRYEINHLDLGVAVMSAIANATVISANQVNAKAIIAITRKGVTPRAIADYRPASPIIAATDDEKTYHQLRLSWNTYPLYIEKLNESIEEAFDDGIKLAVAAGYIKDDDLIVLAGGVKKSNLQTGILKIHK